MFFSKTLYPLLSTASTMKTGNRPNMTEKLLTGMLGISTKKTVQIQISWLLMKPVDLDLHV